MSRSLATLFTRNLISKNEKCFLAKSQVLLYTPVATLKDFPPPPDYSDVVLPERRRLKLLERVPQYPPNQRPPKMQKHPMDMRGPELVHNKLQYCEFGIQALTGGRLRWGHYEMLRLGIIRKFDESRMYALWRIDSPWKPKTKKGQGHRMGGGKGSIDHYVYPVRAGRIIIELGGKCEFAEVKDFLSNLAGLLPFPARAVSREMLEEEDEEEKKKIEMNVNPFSFEYCVKNNIFGCKIHLSKYDQIWHGKYR